MVRRSALDAIQQYTDKFRAPPGGQCLHNGDIECIAVKLAEEKNLSSGSPLYSP